MRNLPNADPRFVRLGKNLKAGLTKARMPFSVKVWRTIGPAEAALYTQMKIGDAIPVSGFLSTSMSKQAAEEFGAKFNRALIEIIVPEGTKGAAYVHPFPTEQYQQFEVLLNDGVELRIVRNTGTRLVLIAGEERP